MKRRIKKIKEKLTVAILNVMLCFYMAQNYVYAGIGSSKLFTGTKRMFNDMKTPLIGLSSVIGIVMIIYNLIRMKMADEMDTKMYKKRIRVILVCLVLVVSVAALIPMILSYYK